jgi:hypothetical protein
MYYTIEKNLLIKGSKEALEQFYYDVKPLPDDYEENKYIVEDGELVLNTNFEEEQEQKERERIAMLSLTRGDVFRGLLMAKQVTRAQIRAMIENNETLTMLQKEMALIDFDEALNFYRGNGLIDTLGATLGITKEQLDKFFETNDYTVLLPADEIEVE